MSRRLTCFIIMPYAAEFNACHESIRRAARSVTDPCPVEPRRLDDDPVAGRIPAKLEQAIRDADLCIADITPPLAAHPDFSNSNVMWEIGYAMALNKTPILIAADQVRLPFDLHDMQHIRYDRKDPMGTLEAPLARSISATAREVLRNPRSHGSTDGEHLLRTIVSALAGSSAANQSITAALAHVGSPGTPAEGPEPSRLIGAWRNVETDSFAYVARVGGRVFAPYCYGGNHELSGVYFDWAPVNGWFYARFLWVHAPIRGFSFLRPEGPDEMNGAWWYDGEAHDDPYARPETHTGWQSKWCRMPGAPTPPWAQRFIDDVEAHGLDAVLTSISQSKVHRRGRRATY